VRSISGIETDASASTKPKEQKFFASFFQKRRLSFLKKEQMILLLQASARGAQHCGRQARVAPEKPLILCWRHTRRPDIVFRLT
jgi:hypothetical protein